MYTLCSVCVCVYVGVECVGRGTLIIKIIKVKECVSVCLCE